MRFLILIPLVLLASCKTCKQVEKEETIVVEQTTSVTSNTTDSTVTESFRYEVAQADSVVIKQVVTDTISGTTTTTVTTIYRPTKSNRENKSTTAVEVTSNNASNTTGANYYLHEKMKKESAPGSSLIECTIGLIIVIVIVLAIYLTFKHFASKWCDLN